MTALTNGMWGSHAVAVPSLASGGLADSTVVS